MAKNFRTKKASIAPKEVSADKSYIADKKSWKSPTMGDRGIGSSFMLGQLRDEAETMRAQRKVPGSLGYSQNLDTSKVTNYSSKTRGRKL